jgi:hypothetical protein
MDPRASVLYFILNDLYKINPIYQVPIRGISNLAE